MVPVQCYTATVGLLQETRRQKHYQAVQTVRGRTERSPLLATRVYANGSPDTTRNTLVARRMGGRTMGLPPLPPPIPTRKSRQRHHKRRHH